MSRNASLTLFGVAGVVFEALQKSPNPTLIAGFFGLLLSPAFLTSDERRRQHRYDEDREDQERRPRRRSPDDEDGP